MYHVRKLNTIRNIKRNNTMSHKIAVIGAGNGGQAMAGHFAMAGYEVNIFDYFAEPINKIKEQGHIKLTGAVQGIGKINVASTDMQKVVEGTHIIMVVNPAIYHNKIAKELAKHLKKEQIIFLNPSSVFGAFAFKKALENAGFREDVIIAESNTLLYTARLEEHTKVNIGGKKDRILVAVFPSYNKEKVFAMLKPAIPEIEECDSVFATSFDSTNAMVHPLPTIMNASWAESGSKFKYYHEGIGATIGKFIEGMDEERVNIGKKLGLTLGKDLFTMFMQYEIEYNSKGESLSEVFKHVKAYENIYAASNIRSRYIYEDVPTGLVPFITIGKVLGLPVQKMELCLRLCEMMLDEDFEHSENARNLKNLGLEGLSIDSILKYAETGKKE